MRWVDYSGKYGLAYQLSNSLAGMYFNDSTSIILSSEGKAFDYLSVTGEATTGIIGQHPPDLEKKIKLALRYKGYMADNLHGVEATMNTNGQNVFLSDFRRVTNAVLFRMSDNVFQVWRPKSECVLMCR
jgi:POLO box duplicated region